MKAKVELRSRRNDLDWLRVIGVLGVFLYHSLHFFDPDDWSVKNLITYPWVGVAMALLAQWMMPLMFVISGASVFYASRKGGAIGFLRDKVLRLLVPLLVGVFTFSMVQVYVERVSHNQFQGNFFDFVPHYFEGMYMPGSTGNFAWHGMHLWYLLLLFILTVLIMPLFWWLKGEAGGKVLRRLGEALALPGAIVLLLVPTFLLRYSGGLGIDLALGGWRIMHYPWFFLAGYLIVSCERVQQRVIQARWVCLALTLILVALTLVTDTEPNQLQFLAVWPGILASLGFAMKHLTFNNRFLTYANEAVLPFYILHQNVLLWLGFFVVTWSVPDLGKYFIIAVSSFLVTMLSYEYLVRRFNILRFLFGMRVTRRAASSMGRIPATRPTA